MPAKRSPFLHPDVDRIRLASQNISALWQAADTTPQDRKAIVRCLVDRVVVHVEQHSEHVDVSIHWHGGFTSQHQVVRPVGCYKQLRDYDLLIERIKTMHEEGKTLPAIADRLNQEGFVPPRRRGLFTAGALGPIMQHLGLVGERYRDDLLGPDEWRIRDLATKLNAPDSKVYYWATQGWVHSRKAPSGKHWILWADDDEIKRLGRLTTVRNSHIAQRNPNLVKPKTRKT